MNLTRWTVAIVLALGLFGLEPVRVCLGQQPTPASYPPPETSHRDADDWHPGWMADSLAEPYPPQDFQVVEEVYEEWPSAKGWGTRMPGHTLRDRLATYHDHPDDPSRHIGKGRPLIGSSWRNRPYHVDLFMGSILLQNLMPGEVHQSPAFVSGVRLGHDFDHYWGGEFRLAAAQGRLTYPRDRFRTESSQVFLFDYSVQYYPWGDSVWRPYATVGLGGASFLFDDRFYVARDQTLFGLPFGVGLKYYWLKNCSLRFELIDNFAFGSRDINAMHNLSFTGGLEYRFGAGTSPYAR